MKIEFTEEEFNEFLSNVVITALEGGSNYWCYVDAPDISERRHGEAIAETIVRQIIEGKSIEVFDSENDESHGFISRESCLKAIDSMLNNDYRDTVLNIVREQYDAEDADVFFQFSVMGEIVFG